MSLPILRELSPAGRGVVLATLAVSLAAIAMEWVLGLSGTPIFVASAVAILGLAYVIGLSTERLGLDHRAAGRRRPQRDVRQHRRADHRLLRPAGRAASRSSRRRSPARSSATCCWSSAPAVLVGGLRHGIQTLRRQDRRPRTRRCWCWRSIGLFVPGRVRGLVAAPQAEPEPARIEESVLVAIVLLVAATCVNLVYRFTQPARDARRPGEPSGHAGPPGPRAGAIVVLVVVGRAAGRPVGGARRLDRSVHRQLRADAVLRRRHHHPDHRQPRRAPRGRPPGVQGNRIEFSMAVAIGASLQVALFVAPVLVLLGWSSTSRWTWCSRRWRSPRSAAAVGIAR